MSKKVLIVDDEEVIRRVVRTHLLKRGYEVTEARDGEEALRHLEKEAYDLLICDVMMPRKDGWEVLREVKSDARTRSLPVLLLTGRNQDPDMAKGRELGATHYMTKPFTKSQLLDAIELVFGERMNGGSSPG
jgi:CheY-like chemotaxis protein